MLGKIQHLRVEDVNNESHSAHTRPVYSRKAQPVIRNVCYWFTATIAHTVNGRPSTLQYLGRDRFLAIWLFLVSLVNSIVDKMGFHKQ
jgi:hypothetical protein